MPWPFGALVALAGTGPNGPELGFGLGIRAQDHPAYVP